MEMRRIRRIIGEGKEAMTQHCHLIFVTITAAHQCRKVDESEAVVLLQFSATFKYCGTEGGGGS